jgi:hypothetical protein
VASVAVGSRDRSQHHGGEFKSVQAKRQLDGGSSASAARGEEQRGQKLCGKLREAFLLLCQAGERFVSYLGEGRQQGSESAIEVGDPQQAAEAISAEREASRTKPAVTFEESDGGKELDHVLKTSEEELSPLLASRMGEIRDMAVASGTWSTGHRSPRGGPRQIADPVKWTGDQCRGQASGCAQVIGHSAYLCPC